MTPVDARAPGGVSYLNDQVKDYHTARFKRPSQRLSYCPIADTVVHDKYMVIVCV